MMFPPRPKTNYYKKMVTQQNTQFLMIKQFTQYYPSIEQKALKVSSTNITNSSRPSSSKLLYHNRSQKGSSIGPKIVNKSAIRNSSKSNNSSVDKIVKQAQVSPFLAQPRSFSRFPKITSKYWAIYQAKSQKLIYGNNIRKRIQVASLTKIMNLYTIIHILTKYQLNAKNIKFPVSQWVSTIIGTSASLQKRDVVSLQDLLYGMMLPSGNDAATQIALIGGAIIKLGQMGATKKIYERFDIQSLIQCRSNIIRYLSEMNKISLILDMKQTKWSNVHGLSNKQNKTTIADMCILCKNAMKNQLIRKIVNTKIYSCQVQSYFSMFNQGQCIISRSIIWQNTNKMLWKGWNGIKTGVTPNAGPCLAAMYKQEGDKKIGKPDCQYIVIIANCISMNQRWQEVEGLVKWVTETCQQN